LSENIRDVWIASGSVNHHADGAHIAWAADGKPGPGERMAADEGFGQAELAHLVLLAADPRLGVGLSSRLL